jgi:chaperonin cofactor prefoldin
MKKLVISEEQYKRLFTKTQLNEQDSWMNMDDEEKREYLQQFTSDADKIEQLIRSTEDPTAEFEGHEDQGVAGDITVERSTDDILNDMDGGLEELKRSIDIIKSRM